MTPERIYGKCEWVSPVVCGFPETHPSLSLYFLHQLHLSSLPLSPPPSSYLHPSLFLPPFLRLLASALIGVTGSNGVIGNCCVHAFVSQKAARIGREESCCLQRKVGSVWLCLFSGLLFLLILERKWNPDASLGLDPWLKDFNVIKPFGKAHCVQWVVQLCHLPGNPRKSWSPFLFSSHLGDF